ncbi:MAG: DUF2061 domain-containing protein [Bacteroidia bacterium]
MIDLILEKSPVKGQTRSISVLKSISWRVVGTIDTFIISYIVTGSPKLAVSISSVEVITKIILYYFHERLWNKLK